MFLTIEVQMGLRALRGSSPSGVIAAARGTVSVPIGPVGVLEATKILVGGYNTFSIQ